MIAIHGSVHGLVQGVGFRYATRRAARRLDVVGWVRNEPAGSVEFWAQGPPDAVARFRRFLEDGPPGAAVVRTDVDEVDPDPSLAGFEVRL
jgi:acylphosphatase